MSESVGVLSSWESFYVIVGSSGGALIGLQFVVITLIAGRRNLAHGGRARAHSGRRRSCTLPARCSCSAIMSAPWTSLGILSIVLLGVRGRRAGLQRHRGPPRPSSDGLRAGPGGLDLARGAAVRQLRGADTSSAALLIADSRHALFAIGTAALGLLVIGIHNAWDTVTHHRHLRLRRDGTVGHDDAHRHSRFGVDGRQARDALRARRTRRRLQLRAQRAEAREARARGAGERARRHAGRGGARRRCAACWRCTGPASTTS